MGDFGVGTLRVAADSAVTPADELEVARRVYGLFEVIRLVEGPLHRFTEVAAHIGMDATRVRRYVGLHVAPPEIRELFLDGKLSARMVELLQFVDLPLQRVLAERLVCGRETVLGLETEMEVDGRRATKRWTEEARVLEQAVLRAGAILEPYLAGPRGKVLQAYQGIGSGSARRQFVALLRTFGEELLMLARILENWAEEPKGEAHAVGAVASNG